MIISYLHYYQKLFFVKMKSNLGLLFVVHILVNGSLFLLIAGISSFHFLLFDFLYLLFYIWIKDLYKISGNLK